MNTTTTPARRCQLLKSDEVADMLGISVRTLWRLLAENQIPQPIRFNRKLVRFLESDIDAFMDRLGSKLDPAEASR